MKTVNLNKIISYFILGSIAISAIFIYIIIRPVDNFDYSQYSSKTVIVDNGVQIISMKANTGYSPNRILAKSNIKTKLRVETNNTYDCTSMMSIPALNINRSLPSTGNTDIDLPSQITGSEIHGYCGTSTYQFIIKFS